MPGAHSETTRAVRSRMPSSGMRQELTLLGVPTSAGAFAPGQERAPRELRSGRAGEEAARGRHRGHRPRRFRGLALAARSGQPEGPEPERGGRHRCGPPPAGWRRRWGARRPAARAGRRLHRGDRHGGGPSAPRPRASGLVYFDVHPDLNTPESVRPGALDWMGMAHMLDEPGAVAELSGIGPRTPLLGRRPGALLRLRAGAGHAVRAGGARAARSSRASRSTRWPRDPEGDGARVVEEFAPRFDRLLLHFDVDTIDFTDAPLSENTGRNEGLPLRGRLQRPRRAGGRGAAERAHRHRAQPAPRRRAGTDAPALRRAGRCL